MGKNNQFNYPTKYKIENLLQNQKILSTIKLRLTEKNIKTIKIQRNLYHVSDFKYLNHGTSNLDMKNNFLDVFKK